MDEKARQATARLAGLMYLLVMAAFIAPFAMLQSIAAPEGFAETAANAAAREPLYRAALVIQLAGCAGIILLSTALYSLVKAEGAHLALVALLWRCAEAIALTFGTLIRYPTLANYVATVEGAGGADNAALHHLFSSAIGASSYAAFIFLGLGSAIFFYLFFRARLIPRAFSGFAILASVLMIALAFGYLLAPAQVGPIAMMGMAPMFLAEVGIGLWLLIAGVKRVA